MIDLDKEKIRNEINKCYGNSKSLLQDADYLFDDNQIARSYAIFVLRIEEIQKINVLFRIFMEKENNKKFTKEDKVYYSKFFLSHTLKIKAVAV